jgi:ferric-dicitrate binding protein FerR (iron transport regulator)
LLARGTFGGPDRFEQNAFLEETTMADHTINDGIEQVSPDLDRRRCVFRIAKAAAVTLAAAATFYVAPLALRIADQAEAKGSKRKVKIKGGSRRRPKMPSRRRRRRVATHG